jgi:5-methylcytosine-specific restriction endonuclease McrA
MKHYCNQPGCPNPPAYRGMCSAHGQQRERETHDAGRRAFYTSALWKQFRLRRIAADPFCKCGQPAVEVDHITPLENGGAPFTFENTQPLCKHCHGKKTREEQRQSA